MAFSVDYEELDGYPRSAWDEGHFDAERRVLVAWEDRVTFLTELDQYANLQYPYDDGPSEALVKRVKIFPFDCPQNEGSLAEYNWSVIQILHSTRGPKWSTGLGAYIHETFRPGSQYLGVDGGNLRWSSDDAKVEPGDHPTLDYTLGEYTVTFYRLLTVPAWVLTRPGVCNSNVVAAKILPLSFAAQTLKYNGCTIDAEWSLGKLLRYTVSAKYLFKASKWNYYWRPDASGGGNWEQMETVDGDTYIQHPLQTIFLYT